MEFDAIIIVTTNLTKKHFMVAQSSWFRQNIYIKGIACDRNSIDKPGNRYKEGPERSAVFEDEGFY